ncbi:MAG: hypothetical protein ABW360_15505 [Phenylobacterium sp.]
MDLEWLIRLGVAFLLVLPIPAILTWRLTVRWAWVGGVVGIVLWDLLGLVAVYVIASVMRIPRDAPPLDRYSVRVGFTETWVEVLWRLIEAWLLGLPFHAAAAAAGLLCIAGGFETRRRRVATAGAEGGRRPGDRPR